MVQRSIQECWVMIALDRYKFVWLARILSQLIGQHVANMNNRLLRI